MRRPRTAAGELRYRLRADQVEFAGLLGKSLGLVRQIEAGVPPSPGVQQRLLNLALQHGYQDLADDFLQDREEPHHLEDLPRQVFTPRQVAATTSERLLAEIERRLTAIEKRLAALETTPSNKDGI